MGKDFKAIIVMGVSGCGKTTVGKLLAERMGWTFIEGDEYHSPENVRKMSGSIPLTDKDRLPWLDRLHSLLKEKAHQGCSVVLACSALKQSYRDLLSKGFENVSFAYLKGDYNLISDRMHNRKHFMRAGMLKSQFESLEEPNDAVAFSITGSPDEIVNEITQRFNLEDLHSGN